LFTVAVDKHAELVMLSKTSENDLIAVSVARLSQTMYTLFFSIFGLITLDKLQISRSGKDSSGLLFHLLIIYSQTCRVLYVASMQHVGL